MKKVILDGVTNSSGIFNTFYTDFQVLVGKITGSTSHIDAVLLEWKFMDCCRFLTKIYIKEKLIMYVEIIELFQMFAFFFWIQSVLKRSKTLLGRS